MKTKEYVKERLKEMGTIDSFGTKKEIKELPNILHDDEELLYITSGLFDGTTWLISCTNKRIIFLDKGMIFGLKQKEIPLDKINSIEHKTGLVLGEISVWDGASKIEIKSISKKTVKPMVDILNESIQKYKNKTNSFQQTSGQNNDDVTLQLQKLAKLKEQGILTEEEFAQGKAKLLNN
ncbi:PH domain-containing protein [Clostridium sp.]|uniref:PH domain-containing protein n=1 Tax=Clostridium sp. TaxID=1506 RepID=UPI00283F42ED|nr:PH domain-containing protein [Clostridium sp.]MDR3597422.1 PH domain-containing protein [Clostridium sp.]